VLVLDVHAHPDLLEIEAISVDSDRVSDAPRPVWRRSAALSYWDGVATRTSTSTRQVVGARGFRRGDRLAAQAEDNDGRGQFRRRRDSTADFGVINADDRTADRTFSWVQVGYRRKSQADSTSEEGGCAMPVSDDFTKLKEQVENADRSIKAAVAKNDAELEAMVDEARKKADDRATQLRTKASETADQAERHWNEVQSDWDQHIQRLRERMDAKKAELDAKSAESDAEWAEADAYDAVQFAATAITEAQYATLDAVMARRKADVMAAAN
jgi:hypothetical protein